MNGSGGINVFSLNSYFKNLFLHINDVFGTFEQNLPYLEINQKSEDIVVDCESTSLLLLANSNLT